MPATIHLESGADVRVVDEPSREATEQVEQVAKQLRVMMPWNNTPTSRQ